MKPQLVAIDLLPTDGANFLRSAGWLRRSGKNEVASLWYRHRDGAEQEVLLPLRPEAPDYQDRWLDLLEQLAGYEDRSIESMTEAVLYAGADVMEWGVGHESLIDFTIPLADGHRFLDGMRAAVVAATSSTINPKSYFGHTITKQAYQHANQVRIGQTRRGSYVIPLISRLPSVEDAPSQDRLDLHVEVEPFERRVVLRLSEALSTIEDLALQQERAPSPSQLIEAVHSGVSYELCTAVASILEASSIDVVSIAVELASHVPGRRNPPKQIQLPQRAEPVLHDMAKRLRGSDYVAQQQIYGFVRSFRRDPDERLGTVTVLAETGRVKRQIRMRLQPEDYDNAAQANIERRPVIVTGTLQQEAGRTWWMSEVSSFGFAQFIDS